MPSPALGAGRSDAASRRGNRPTPARPRGGCSFTNKPPVTTEGGQPTDTMRRGPSGADAHAPAANDAFSRSTRSASSAGNASSQARYCACRSR